MDVFRIIDKDGRAEPLAPVMMDCLPMDLIGRSFGRLISWSGDPDIGLAAVYLTGTERPAAERSSVWHPYSRKARPSPLPRRQTLEGVIDLFERNADRFLNNPRFDPPAD